jgi:hypothetical protein
VGHVRIYQCRKSNVLRRCDAEKDVDPGLYGIETAPKTFNSPIMLTAEEVWRLGESNLVDSELCSIKFHQESFYDPKISSFPVKYIFRDNMSLTIGSR